MCALKASIHTSSFREKICSKINFYYVACHLHSGSPSGSRKRKTFESSFYFSNQFGKFLLERKYYFVYTCTMQCYNQNVQDFWIKIFSTWRMDGGIYSQQLEAMNWWKEWSMFLRQQVWSYSNSSPPTHVIVLFIANVTILLIRYLSICPSFIVNISFN